MFKKIYSVSFSQTKRKKEQDGTPTVAALTLRVHVTSAIFEMSRWSTGCDSAQMAISLYRLFL
jgi:hypothetical protein